MSAESKVFVVKGRGRGRGRGEGGVKRKMVRVRYIVFSIEGNKKNVCFCVFFSGEKKVGVCV